MLCAFNAHNKLKFILVYVMAHKTVEKPLIFITFAGFHEKMWDRHGHDRMVAGFITTYAISTYPH